MTNTNNKGQRPDTKSEYAEALEDLENLIKAGQHANQDSWHVVGLPWNDHNPYINTISEDPHLGQAIIDVIEVDFIEGEDDEEITKKEIELEAEMNANMRFVAMAGNYRRHFLAIRRALRLADALERKAKRILNRDKFRLISARNKINEAIQGVVDVEIMIAQLKKEIEE